METFAAVGWYDSPGRGSVAIISAPRGFDPSFLVGQQVNINGVLRTAKSVEPPELAAAPDPTGQLFGLLV